MNKKGFTLIELLVVIVILAIIALITVPNALAMITTAQQRSDQRSVEGVKRALEVICLKNQTLPTPLANPIPVAAVDIATAINAELRTPIHAVVISGAAVGSAPVATTITFDSACNVLGDARVQLRSGTGSTYVIRTGLFAN